MQQISGLRLEKLLGGAQERLVPNMSLIVDWSSLPRDLVSLILEKLTKIQDNIRFCAVCKPWFKVGKDQKLQRMKTVTHNQPPLLISHHINGSYRVYDVDERKTYVNFHARCANLTSSSFGWLVITGTVLKNPFSRKRMELPKYSLGYFKQVIFSDDPSLNPNNYIVCGIGDHTSTVAILRSGDKSWINVHLKNFGFIFHALFYKGNLYVMAYKDSLMKIYLDDNYSDAPIVEYLIQGHVQGPFIVQTLVESVDGELLCIQRFELTADERFYCRTKKFEVFKLGKTKDGENEPKWDWIKMESLGNQTLFVGYCYSKCIPSGDNFSPNSIYYAYNRDDVGIFSLDDQSIHLFYDYADHKDLISNWISPTLQ